MLRFLLLAGTTVASLVGCATSRFGWEPTESGCVSRGLFEAFEDQTGSALGPMDIRIGKLTDDPRSPSLLLHFQRRFIGVGIHEGPPRVLLAVGDFRERTCSIVVSAANCKASESAYQALSSMSLPIGFRNERPQTLTQMHGPTYYLLARDALGNRIAWSFYGAPGHPIKAAIDSALAELSSCAEPARAEFSEPR